jgi:hypothetical protein
MTLFTGSKYLEYISIIRIMHHDNNNRTLLITDTNNQGSTYWKYWNWGKYEKGKNVKKGRKGKEKGRKGKENGKRGRKMGKGEVIV